jgi:photosystem II stability/assembly factor-like uncharacterized protein
MKINFNTRTGRHSMLQAIVGTENGVHTLVALDGGWQAGPAFLPDVQVSALARESATTVLASTMGHGLFRLDVERGEAVPLGAGTLPLNLRGVTIAPSDPKTIYVACEPAAVWKSTDGGASWTENVGVKALAEARKWKYPIPAVPSHVRHVMVDRDDPRIVYAAIQVGGLLRSDDGGASWREILDGLDPDVHSLFQHPSDPNIVYAVCGGGGPLGDDRPDPLPLPMGRPLYRSRDRGLTWECISAPFERTYGIWMAGAATSPPTLVAGIGRDQPPFWRKRPAGADAVVLVSRDDGTTWTQSGGGLPDHFSTMVEAVEVDRQRGNRVLIGTGGSRRRDANGAAIVGGSESSVYVSDDLTGHWTQIPIELPGITTIVAL